MRRQRFALVGGHIIIIFIFAVQSEKEHLTKEKHQLIVSEAALQLQCTHTR